MRETTKDECGRFYNCTADEFTSCTGKECSKFFPVNCGTCQHGINPYTRDDRFCFLCGAGPEHVLYTPAEKYLLK